MKLAVIEAQRAHRPHQLAECQYALAMLYFDSGQLTNAVNQITNNFKFLRTFDDKPTLAANYLLIIELFQELKNKPMQLQYTNRYIALANSIVSTADQMYAYSFKADLLEEQGRFKEAGVFFRQSLHYAYLTHNPVYIIASLTDQGTNYRHLKQFDASIKLFDKATSMAKPLKLRASMAKIQRELAATYLALRRYEDALKAAEYALALSRQNNVSTSIIASLASLAAVLEATGQFERALAVYKEQYQRKEQKFTESSIEQIAQMQAQYETATKEQTIRLLQKNAQINSLKLLRQQHELKTSQRNQLTNAIIILLLLILVGIVFVFLQRSRRSYQLLQQTTHDLTTANGVKDKLFSVISHDLRSPLASMKTLLHQARQHHVATSTALLDQLDRQVDRTLTLLTNLLDWSLLQLTGVELTQQSILLQDIVNETIEEASELINQKQIGLINQVVDTHAVLVNKHQLRSVLRNLFNNALKFTPVHGYVRLQSVKHADFIELSIRDSGVGMSPDQLANLLSKPDIRTGTLGEIGTGLGLRISKELVERLEGTMQFESWPNKGTLVRIWLKAQPAQTLAPSQQVNSVGEIDVHTT